MRGNGGNADFAPEMTPFAPENMPFAPENGPHSPIPILATKGIIPIPAPRGMAPRGMAPLSRLSRCSRPARLRAGVPALFVNPYEEGTTHAAGTP